MDDKHVLPHTWAKEAWRTSRLEVLIPATVGLALGHLALAILGLRSAHTFFLYISIGAAAFAAVRTFAFLYRLSEHERAGLRVALNERDIQELFLPIILSVVMYGIIAPNMMLGVIFACISIPHAAMLAYLAITYADVTVTPLQIVGAGISSLRERTNSVVAVAMSVVRNRKKTPGLTVR